VNITNGKDGSTLYNAFPLTTERSVNGPTRYGQDVVMPDRRAAASVVGGRPENPMKRKTLRRHGDGQVSVSESFTESETVDDGICLLSAL